MKLIVRGNIPLPRTARRPCQASSYVATIWSPRTTTMWVSGKKFSVVGVCGPETSINVPVSAMAN